MSSRGHPRKPRRLAAESLETSQLLMSWPILSRASPRFVSEGAFFRRQERKASSEVEACKAIAAVPQKLPR